MKQESQKNNFLLTIKHNNTMKKKVKKTLIS